jgi:hypothetical protein
MEVRKGEKRKTAAKMEQHEGAFVRVAKECLVSSPNRSISSHADKPPAQLKSKKTRKTPNPWTQAVNLVLIRHLYVPKHDFYIFRRMNC